MGHISWPGRGEDQEEVRWRTKLSNAAKLPNWPMGTISYLIIAQRSPTKKIETFIELHCWLHIVDQRGQ